MPKFKFKVMLEYGKNPYKVSFEKFEEFEQFVKEESLSVMKRLMEQGGRKKDVPPVQFKMEKDEPEEEPEEEEMDTSMEKQVDSIPIDEVPDELPPLEQPNPAPINNPGVACPICGKVVMPELMAMHVQMKHPNAV
jgi:hypothetical protein